MARSSHHRSRSLAAAVVLLACSLLSGCGLLSGPRPLSEDAPLVMQVSSPSLNGKVLLAQFTCHHTGKREVESPSVYWANDPPGTKSFALVMDDSAAPITPWVYWLVFDIGRDTTDIQEGALPPGARLARNSTGQPDYEPPCPVGAPHKYRITVYALNAVLGSTLPNNPQLLPTWTTIAPHVIARGTITVTACPAASAASSTPQCRASKTASGE
jgi:Raf kinase inhibitor-like YbhB/YbcL family protein